MTPFICDEVHELSPDLNLLLCVLRERVLRVYNATHRQRLVLMTATGDILRLRRYFGVHGHLVPADALHTVTAPTRTSRFKRQITYHSKGDLTYPAVAAEIVGKEWKKGSILIFVAGKQDMKEVEVELDNVLKTQIFRPHVHCLFSGQPAKEREAALSDNFLKILISTNVAESGITLKDIALVVDPGLRKEPWLDPRDGIYELAVTRISQSEAQQRAGRTGRTCDGRVIRLYSQEGLAARHVFPISAMQMGDAAGVLLECAAMLGSTYHSLDLLEAPSDPQFRCAQKFLMAVGAVNAAGEIPEQHPVASPRVFFHNGASQYRLNANLMGAKRCNCLPTMIKLVAILEGEYMALMRETA